MKAIIVDDSLVIRNIIEKAIKPMGYDAEHAENGKVALELLKKHANEVELILLDWNMPVLDGYETIKCINEKEDYKHVCIVMISTESEDEKIDQALAAGAHGYLAKPFTEEELAAKVQTTLDNFRSA